MRDPILLNDFDIKYTINALRDYNVIDIIFNTDNFNSPKYIIFFKLDDFVFSYMISYRNWISDKRASFSAFVETAIEDMEEEHSIINNDFFDVQRFEPQYIDSVIYTLYLRADFTHRSFVDAGLIKEHLSDKDLRLIKKTARTLFKQGLDRKTVLKKIFKMIGISLEDIESKIKINLTPDHA